MLGMAMSVLRTQGPSGFMSGWTANYARLGPQTVLIFLINEQLRKALGMRAF
jgi:solute carrier family 25 uncoupling protein 8/9